MAGDGTTGRKPMYDAVAVGDDGEGDGAGHHDYDYARDQQRGESEGRPTQRTAKLDGAGCRGERRTSRRSTRFSVPAEEMTFGH